MERIWLKSYPSGMPTEIDIHEFRSISAMFSNSVATYGNHVAYACMGKTMTYRELDRLSRNFAAYLAVVLNLPPGTRVALMMPNMLQYPVAMFGVLRAGYTVVNTNPLYTPRELEYQLKDSGAEAIVIVENCAKVLADVIDRTDLKHVITTQIGDMLGFPKGPIVNIVVKFIRRLVPAWRFKNAVSFRSALRRGIGTDWRPPKIDHEGLAFLQYTGGTTGVPKGAMLTHGNIIANLQACHAWLKPVLEEGRETIITALPFYHIFALTANCLTFFKIGATNVLITDARDIPGLVKELARHPFSAITGVNTLFNALLNNPDFAKLDFTHLRVTLGGGMAVTRPVAEKWKQVTGKPLIEAYGLTETSPAATINPLNISDYNGSIGLPIPSTEVAIRDDEGRDLPIGHAGELCIRGPQVMKGYWQRPAETAKVFTEDGFLRTGDIATIDESGYIRIVDRKKDMILSSGFKVWPNEIEEVVAMHPGVLEVGAVGVPDANAGESVKIVVVKRDPELTQQALILFCREKLTGYKVPRIVEFRKELPKNNVGKILRRALRDKAA